MMLEVLVGAGIMLVGMMFGWAACNVNHKKYEAVEKPVNWDKLEK